MRSAPQLTGAVTSGDIARALDEPLPRVRYVLDVRLRAQPIRRVGIVRLYAPNVLDLVRRELTRMRTSKPEVTA